MLINEIDINSRKLCLEKLAPHILMESVDYLDELSQLILEEQNSKPKYTLVELATICKPFAEQRLFFLE
jgi:hypothetical protein